MPKSPREQPGLAQHRLTLLRCSFSIEYSPHRTNGLLTQKVDAKGQVLNYVYDGYHRLSQILYGVSTVLRTFHYDSNPLDTSFSQNSLGRLAAVYHVGNGQLQFSEMYSYTGSGLPAAKRQHFLIEE